MCDLCGALRFRIIINTLVRVGPAILTFGQLILVRPDGFSPGDVSLHSSSSLLQVVYYTFAMVGMELFGGKIQFFGGGSEEPTRFFCGNLLLNGTSFAQLNYCKNNFNDVLSSFVLLVELTVVNQWHHILLLLRHTRTWSFCRVLGNLLRSWSPSPDTSRRHV